MIRINLLPQELRKETVNAIRVPYIPLAILAGTLFLLMTFFFYGDYLRVRAAYKKAQREWMGLSPSMEQLKALENQIEVEMRSEKEFLEKNVLNAESMTQLLFWVNEFLPPKGWLTELKAVRENGGCRLTLKGVVLASGTQTSIEQIEEYFRKLKAKLPSKTSVALTTSREVKEKTEGTAFVAQLGWGVTQDI